MEGVPDMEEGAFMWGILKYRRICQRGIPRAHSFSTTKVCICAYLSDTKCSRSEEGAQLKQQ